MNKNKMKKCTACKIEREVEKFLSKTGRECKQCQRCLEMKRKTQKPKCDHKTRCEDCGVNIRKMVANTRASDNKKKYI